MTWSEISQILNADGYVEFIEDSPNQPYLSSCLHSLECTGPTFFHYFGRGLEIKVITRCANCGRIRDLTKEGADPLSPVPGPTLPPAVEG